MDDEARVALSLQLRRRSIIAAEKALGAALTMSVTVK
jgi:hypothetical protein